MTCPLNNCPNRTCNIMSVITCMFMLCCIAISCIMVCIDVLHALDLRVTQDLLGNLFWESLDCLWGDLRNKDLRFTELKKSIKEYYKTFKPPTQIDSITQEMVKQEKKPPKLKA